MPITQSSTGTGNTATYKKLYDRLFDEVKLVKDEVPVQGKDLFHEIKSPREDYTKGTMSSTLDLPTVSDDEDLMPFVVPVTGYDKTFNLVQVRSAVKVTRKMAELDQHALIAAMFGGLFKSIQRKREFQYAGVLNGSFADLGTDGVALFADAHPHVDTFGGTWDNLNATSDLTPAAYTAMRLNARSSTGEKGFINPRTINELIVVAAKEEKALQVMGSEKVSTSDLNGIFAFADESTVRVWDWLTGANNWFGRDKSADMEDNGLFEVIQGSLDISALTNLPHDIIMGQRLRFTNAVGATLLKSWQGNVGS